MACAVIVAKLGIKFDIIPVLVCFQVRVGQDRNLFNIWK